MIRQRIARGLVAALALGFAATEARGQSIWDLGASGVWDIPNKRRVAWDPSKGDIGNMGNAGVVFNIAAPPAGAQAGAAAGAAEGYTFWNALAAIPTVRINFVAGAANKANSPLTWGPLAATTLGLTDNNALNFDPRPVTLNQAVTLRSDKMNILGKGVAQFDAFTVNVHEAGHVLGLEHPGVNTQIMSQTGASIQAGGRFANVAQTTPFAGQPMALNAAGVPNVALANGINVYPNPRGQFGLGDALGAITIYSAPISHIASFFTANAGGGGGGTYSYSITNDSAHGTGALAGFNAGYMEREFKIPVDPGVLVTNLTAPAGWSITREAADVLVRSLSTSNDLQPGNSLIFSFFSNDAPTVALPNVHWAINGLGTDSLVDTSFDNDSTVPPMTPSFNINDFGVLDGTFNYQFNAAADQWQTIEFDPVLTPVPEPGSVVLLVSGFLTLLALLRLRWPRACAA